MDVSQRRHAAFREYVTPQLDVVYRVALRLTRDEHDAQDLVQESLLRAFKSIERFDGRYPRAWLLTILRNTHINQVRRRRPDLLDAEVAERLPATGADGRPDATSEQALQDDVDPAIRHALAALSANHRAVVGLVDIDGLSYQEAAELLDVPLGTIMSRLHRARRKVRTRLERRGFTSQGR